MPTASSNGVTQAQSASKARGSHENKHYYYYYYYSTTTISKNDKECIYVVPVTGYVQKKTAFLDRELRFIMLKTMQSKAG